MKKGRLEAFSDGVIAIIITIMVLELHVPAGDHPGDLLPMVPTLLSYILSFVLVGIYWNNHHHLLYAVQRIDGTILWSNLHLLFWLSLMPVATSWLGRSHFARWPVVVYGCILIMAGIAYSILCRQLILGEGPDSQLAKALGRDWKARSSVAIYAAGILLAFVRPWLGAVLYAVVAVMWFIPDRRIERKVAEHKK